MPLSPTYLHRERPGQCFSSLAYDEESFLVQGSDDTYSFGFICDPLTFADESTAEKMNTLMTQDFPEETMLQFCLFGSPDLEEALDRIDSHRNAHPSKHPMVDTLRAAAMTELQFYRGATEGVLEDANGTKARDLQLYICAKVPVNGGQLRPSDYKRLRDLQASTAQAIRTVGLNAEPLTADGLVRLMNVIFNRGPDAEWRSARKMYDPSQLLRDQFVEMGDELAWDKNRIYFDKHGVAACLSPKRYPDKVSISAAGAFIGDMRAGARGLRDPFLLTVNVFYPNAETLRGTIEKKKQYVLHQAYGPMLKFNPRLLKQKEGFECLTAALDDGDRGVQVQTCLTLFSKDEAGLTTAISGARTYYRELGYQMMPDNNFHFPLFMMSLPMNSDRKTVGESYRFKTMATRHATNVLPIAGDWKGTGTPTFQLWSRNGQLMNMCLFDTGSNFNTVVAGTSGGGKSFLINGLVDAYLSTGNARVWIIDVGRSYKKLNQLLGGQFIEFSKDSQVCLNPFSIIRDWEDEADALVGIVGAMAAPTEQLSDFQTSQLLRILTVQYEETGNATTIDDVAKRLLAEKDRRVQDMGHQLYAFTSKGQYGRWFVGENNLDLNNPFIVIELEELKSQLHLQSVVLFQLMYQISNEMYLGDKSVRKELIADEAWSLLTGAGDHIAKFLEGVYRRCRKYGGGATIITQGIADLTNSEVGRAIAENSANYILLPMKSETFKQIERDGLIDLGPGAFQVLKTMRTVPGRYSEIFWYGPKGAGIGRFVANRTKQLLYSTLGHEVEALEQLVASGKTIDEAIAIYIQQERALEARADLRKDAA